jgi:cold shock CspA family protein
MSDTYYKVVDAHFNELKLGERVKFQRGTNPRGPCAVQVSVTQ